MLADIDTNSVAPEKRVDFWRENVLRLFKIDPKIECPIKSDFQSHLQLYQLAHLRFIDTTGTPRKTTVTQGTPDDVFALMVPFEGSLRITQAERSIVLDPSHIGFQNLAHPREVTALTAYHCVTVHIPGRDLRNIFPACDHLSAKAIPVTEGIGAVFVEMVKSLLSRIQTIENQPSIASAIADSFNNLLRATLYSLPLDLDALLPSRLEVYHRERIKSYVRANLRTNLNVDSIAAAVGLSVRYVHSLFKNEPLSLMKWVWSERIDCCRNDLELSALRGRSVSEIAYSWGYNDPAHFSRVFRERFGASPSRYREQALAKARTEELAA